MSVTELRDDQANEWQSWARSNPDDVLAHNKRRRDELAKETSGKKVRLCEFVSDGGVPCVRPHNARGYCASHYQMFMSGRPLVEVREAAQGCSFSSPEHGGCDRQHRARGLCAGHWKQVKEGRDLAPLAPRGKWLNSPPRNSRNGEPWAEWEFDLAMSDMPLRGVALRLGRTYSSVVRARQRRRRMLGLGIEYTKSEADLYDGSDRRGVLYAKDNTMNDARAAQ